MRWYCEAVVHRWRKIPTPAPDVRGKAPDAHAGRAKIALHFTLRPYWWKWVSWSHGELRHLADSFNYHVKGIKQNQKHPSYFWNFSFSFARRRSCHRTLRAEWGISYWKVKKDSTLKQSRTNQSSSLLCLPSFKEPHSGFLCFRHFRAFLRCQFEQNMAELFDQWQSEKFLFFHSFIEGAGEPPVEPLKQGIRVGKLTETAQASTSLYSGLGPSLSILTLAFKPELFDGTFT